MPHRKFNLLVVCSRNIWRSATAEVMFKNDPRFNIRSAGTKFAARHRISHQDVEWADVIVCMEKEHKERIEQTFRTMKLPRIEVIDVPDEYRFMDAELVEILQDKFAELFSS